MFILTRQVGKTDRDPGLGTLSEQEVEAGTLSRAREMEFGGRAQA